MGNKADIAGQRFGRLVAIKPVSTDKYGQVEWFCQCDCGNGCVTIVNRLRKGKTRSCGCLKDEGNNCRHGMAYSRLWRIYSQMKGRCYRESHKRYQDYGGRGITICDEWLGDNGFERFIEWSYSNGYSANLTIDRIDNDKGYFPDNCRWADRKTQGRNTRRNHLMTLNGETKTAIEWSEITGIPYSTLLQRSDALHWDDEKTLTTEAKHGRRICTNE